MLKKVQEAVKMRGDHVGDFLALSASLPVASVQTFSKLIQDWEGGLSEENPYKVTVEAVSANKVRLQMAQEEEAAIAADDTLPIHDTISPRIFVEQGLELLDQRDRLQDDTRRLGTHSKEIQQTRVSERRTRLLRQIAVWNAILELYLSGVTLHKQTRSTENPSESELSVLLPSDLLPAFRVDNKLVNYEWHLRFSQAHDILADLCRQVLILSTMYQSKDRLIRGQSHNTRSATLIHNVQLRINSLAAKYQRYQEALCILGDALNKSGWQTMLQLLADSDLRSLKGGEDASSSEGRRTLSWIWMTQRTDESEMTDTMSEALQIEWCKSRARAQRWQEECILLKEEMRRIIQFHMWEAGKWAARAREATSDGARAYAWRQNAGRLHLASTCTHTWRNVAAYLEMGEGAVEAGSPLIEAPLQVSEGEERGDRDRGRGSGRGGEGEGVELTFRLLSIQGQRRVLDISGNTAQAFPTVRRRYGYRGLKSILGSLEYYDVSDPQLQVLLHHLATLPGLDVHQSPEHVHHRVHRNLRLMVGIQGLADPLEQVQCPVATCDITLSYSGMKAHVAQDHPGIELPTSMPRCYAIRLWTNNHFAGLKIIMDPNWAQANRPTPLRYATLIYSNAPHLTALGFEAHIDSWMITNLDPIFRLSHLPSQKMKMNTWPPHTNLSGRLEVILTLIHKALFLYLQDTETRVSHAHVYLRSTIARIANPEYVRSVLNVLAD
ncbi:hypothetical protein IMY05_C1152001700 [Salix suchowensis]|nr:hypothetical protein IMY05_C1152001700 [Salix suchowensis]